MTHNIKARYFEISERDKPGSDFHEILQSVAGESDITRRERIISGNIGVRLERLDVDDDFRDGEFCRKQTDNIPPSAGPEGLTVINLPEGNGLGHLAAFRYHMPTRILLLETNRMSATQSRISLYIKGCQPGAIFPLSPVLREDAWDRLGDKKIKKMRIGFAEPKHLEVLENSQDSAAQSAAALAGAYGGLSVELSVSVGRNRKKFLDKVAVVRTIKSILGSGVETNNLEIVSADDDGSDPIDFIEESLREFGEVEIENLTINDAYLVRKAFLKETFDARLNYLKRHFGKA